MALLKCKEKWKEVKAYAVKITADGRMEKKIASKINIMVFLVDILLGNDLMPSSAIRECKLILRNEEYCLNFGKIDAGEMERLKKLGRLLEDFERLCFEDFLAR